MGERRRTLPHHEADDCVSDATDHMEALGFKPAGAASAEATPPDESRISRGGWGARRHATRGGGANVEGEAMPTLRQAPARKAAPVIPRHTSWCPGGMPGGNCRCGAASTEATERLADLRRWMESQHASGITVNLADVFEQGRAAGLTEATGRPDPVRAFWAAVESYGGYVEVDNVARFNDHLRAALAGATSPSGSSSIRPDTPAWDARLSAGTDRVDGERESEGEGSAT